MSAREEAELGADADRQTLRSVGELDDAPSLRTLVEQTGRTLAAVSERPDGLWTFRVLDDPEVNAFALPGGYVYVTRGLLAHLQTAGELAAVIGHEIGHVTARHGAEQLSRTRAAQRGLGIFRVIDPNLRHVGGVAFGTAGAAILAHSRDNERQADALALRYLARAGVDRRELVAVLQLLERLTAESGATAPTWLSTHPDPTDRRVRVEQLLRRDGITAVAPTDRHADPTFLAALAGLRLGDDPRAGFVAAGRWYLPARALSLAPPPGWSTRTGHGGLLAGAPDGAALLVVVPAPEPTAAAAAAAFFAVDPGARGDAVDLVFAGVPAIAYATRIPSEPEPLTGLVAFVDHPSGTLAIVALAAASRVRDHAAALSGALASAAPITAPALAGLSPQRIELRATPRAMTLAERHAERTASVDLGSARTAELGVDLATLARLNRVRVDEPLPPGTLLKEVVGTSVAAAIHAVEHEALAGPPAAGS